MAVCPKPELTTQVSQALKLPIWITGCARNWFCKVALNFISFIALYRPAVFKLSPSAQHVFCCAKIGRNLCKIIKGKKKSTSILKGYTSSFDKRNALRISPRRNLFAVNIFWQGTKDTIHVSHSKERRWSKCLSVSFLCTETLCGIGFLIQRLSTMQIHIKLKAVKPSQSTCVDLHTPHPLCGLKMQSKGLGYIVYILMCHRQFGSAFAKIIICRMLDVIKQPF